MINGVHSLIRHPWWRYLWPPAAGICVFLAGLLLRSLIFSRFRNWASRTKWGDVLVKTLRGPVAVWCLIAAIYATVLAWPVSERVHQAAGSLLSILWLISLTLVVLRAADQIIERFGKKLATTLPLTSLTQNLTKAIILVFGALMILNSLGVSITPILTALGVGGLAVALALQDTLSNLFAGIHITMAAQVRIGDYVKMDSGQEGIVTDIGWRSTRVRTLSNSLIVIPNTKLSQAIVTNFDLPTRELAVLIEVGVDYRSDLEKVERVTTEVAREVMKQVPGGMPRFEPFIRYHTFGEYSVNFTVILQGRAFVDQYLLKHEFIKRLHHRYAQEEITIPYPTQISIPGPPAS